MLIVGMLFVLLVLGPVTILAALAVANDARAEDSAAPVPAEPPPEAAGE